MPLRRPEVPVNDLDEVLARRQGVISSPSDDDLVVIKGLAVDLDAQDITRVEPESSAFTHPHGLCHPSPSAWPSTPSEVGTVTV
jgi:hypothetical protein